MKKIIFLLFFTPILVSAQSFKLGFDFEPSYVRIIRDNKSEPLGSEIGIISPIAVTIIPGIVLNKKLTLQGHIGYSLLSLQFSGFEIGMNSLYNFNKRIYASVGFRHHSNEPNSAGNNLSVKSMTLFMLTAGMGYKTSKHFALELEYYYPIKKKKFVYLCNTCEYNPPGIFNYMLRLNLVFRWGREKWE